jgi:hypothetical protein
MVGNLFSVISPHPEDVPKHPEPVHPDTDAALVEMARAAERVIAAWGTQPFLNARAYTVTKLLAREREVQCLGFTKEGWPRHPLYRTYEADLELFQRRTDGAT